MIRNAIGTVAVVGTGTIGGGWAAQFLASGLQVRAFDPSVETEKNLRNLVSRVWPDLEHLNATSGLTEQEAQSALSVHASISDAVSCSDMVQENAPERMELKRGLLAEIEEFLPPDRLIASSTSGLMPSEMQEGMRHPERFLVGHPFNPPHLVPLVEVVGGRETESRWIDLALETYAEIGKRPVHVRNEVPGHIANRLQAALWREAVHLINEGVASVRDVDAALVSGPGLRWAVMGPHLTLHLAGGEGGIEHFLSHLGPAFENWWRDLGAPRLDMKTRSKITEGVLHVVGTRSFAELEDLRDKELLKLLPMINSVS